MLKYTAERDDKRVFVNNGVLLVDDKAVFSLQDGFICNING